MTGVQIVACGLIGIVVLAALFIGTWLRGCHVGYGDGVREGWRQASAEQARAAQVQSDRLKERLHDQHSPHEPLTDLSPYMDVVKEAVTDLAKITKLPPRLIDPVSLPSFGHPHGRI